MQTNVNLDKMSEKLSRRPLVADSCKSPTFCLTTTGKKNLTKLICNSWWNFYLF